MKKASIEEMEMWLQEMRRVQYEHPTANVYYSWEDHEIRITYPLPKDFSMIADAVGLPPQPPKE